MFITLLPYTLIFCISCLTLYFYFFVNFIFTFTFDGKFICCKLFSEINHLLLLHHPLAPSITCNWSPINNLVLEAMDIIIIVVVVVNVVVVAVIVIIISIDASAEGIYNLSLSANIHYVHTAFLASFVLIWNNWS